MTTTHGQTQHLLPELNTHFALSKRIDIIVSFVMKSGVKMLEASLKSAIANGACVRILTSTYMNITDPTALALLQELVGSAGEVRLYNGAAGSFHPKAYIFHGADSNCIFVGSSNVSKSALTDGVEWNYKIEKAADEAAFEAFASRFNYLYDQEAMELTGEVLKAYRDSYVKNTTANSSINKHFRAYQRQKDVVYPVIEPDLGIVADAIPEPLFKPNDAQLEALIELKRTRQEGNRKALVIAATGLGKTFLAAFDSVSFKRVLFVAHLEEILNQAYDTFAKVRGSAGLGKLYDGLDENSQTCSVLFASVQTLMRQNHLGKFKTDDFDYVIYDEVHHYASLQFRKLLDYFSPTFMLGITATPYRMDTQNVFELCDYNVVYEADLFTAINREWLVPFFYYGIHDTTVNYDNITYLNGQYAEKELDNAFNQVSRGDLILKHYLSFRGKRTLGFCSSIKHADYMAAYFVSHNIKAVSVHSGSDSPVQMPRKEAVDALKKGEIDVIFAVSMFNEGLDISELDLLLFLRPTESTTVFLQQLGRGLRKAPNKSKVRILDFIGNYKKAGMVPYLLGGKMSSEPNPRKGLDLRTLLEDPSFYPANCRIDFDFQVIDLMEKMIRSQKGLKVQIAEAFSQLCQELGRVPSRMAFFESMETNFYKSVKAQPKDNPFRNYVSYVTQFDNSRALQLSQLEGFNEYIDLSEGARQFIRFVETTSMNQLYKLPVLLAFVQGDVLKQEVSAAEIVASFKAFYEDVQNRKDLLRNKHSQDAAGWTDAFFMKIAYENPVKFLCQTHGDIFQVDEGTKAVRRVLDLQGDETNPAFLVQVRDAIHFRRSEFMFVRLEKWNEDFV